MDLANVLLNNHIVVALANALAVVIVVHALLAVAVNDVLAQNANRLVCDLPFPCPLLRRLEEFHGIVSSSVLQFTDFISHISNGDATHPRGHREREREQV